MTIVQMGLFVLDTNPLASPPLPKKKKVRKCSHLSPRIIFLEGGGEGGGRGALK